MNYKISKKAATELRELLVRKDTANILYQWYVDQESDGWEVSLILMAQKDRSQDPGSRNRDQTP